MRFIISLQKTRYGRIERRLNGIKRFSTLLSFLRIFSLFTREQIFINRFILSYGVLFYFLK